MTFLLIDLDKNSSESDIVRFERYRRIFDAILGDGTEVGHALLSNSGLIEKLLSMIAKDMQKSLDCCSQEEEEEEEVVVVDAKKGIRIFAFNAAAWLFSGIWSDNCQKEGEAMFGTSNAVRRIEECSEDANQILSCAISSIKAGILVSSPPAPKDDYSEALMSQLGLFLLSHFAVPAVLSPFFPDIITAITTIFSQNFDFSEEQRHKKTIEWSLRAILNMFKLFTPDAKLDVVPFTTLMTGVFNFLLRELGSLEHKAETENFQLVDLSLEVLLLCPLDHVACVDELAVNSIGLLTQFIICQLMVQDLLSTFRVERCAKLWKFWLRVLSLTRASNQLAPCFGDLIAPINGIGSLMQPFQMILKSSRSLAAECLALIMNFVCRDKAERIRDHLTPFKLLLRCVHYILSSEPQDIGCKAALDDYDKSLDIIFESILILVTDMPWSLVGDVLHISVPFSNKKESRSLAADSSAATLIHRSEYQKISLWSILIKLVSIEEKFTAAEYSVRTAFWYKRIGFGVQSLCLLLSKGLSVLVQVDATEHLQNIAVHRKNSLYRRGMLSNRFVHSIFCSRLPTFQAKLLPQMQQACPISQIYIFINALLSCMHAQSVIQSDSELLILDSTVSCWQILTLYLATYLMLETSDSTCQELSSPGSEKIKLVGMSSPTHDEKAGICKLYHVTQMDHESYFSVAHPLADHPSPNSALTKDQLAPKELPTHSSSLSVTTEDYDTQYVLCSNYPPAIEASQIVFSAAMECWTTFWMSTNAGRTAHFARSIFLESLWWFAHRITGFMFNFAVPGKLISLKAALRFHQQLESDMCPDTMGGVLFLMTLSHMHILGEQQTAFGGDQTSIAASWKLVQICLKRTLNSITESGLLPILINWMPELLVSFLPSEFRSGRQSRASNISHTSTIAIGMRIIGSNRSLLTHFMFFVQTEYCAHLATMVSLSPSEQCSPSVVLNIISGLRKLVCVPLIALITSQQFGYSYRTNFLNTAAEQDDSGAQKNTGVATVCQMSYLFLENNRKLLILWLQLEITHRETIDIGKCSEDETPFEWIQSFFSSHDDSVHSAPFSGAQFVDAVIPMQSLVADFRFSLQYMHMLLDVLNIHGWKADSATSSRSLLQYAAGLVSSLSLSLLQFLSLAVQGRQQYSDLLLRSCIYDCISEFLSVFKTVSFLHMTGNIKALIVHDAENGADSIAWKDFVLGNLLDCITIIIKSLVQSDQSNAVEYEKPKELVEQTFLSVMSCCGAIKSQEGRSQVSNTSFSVTLQQVLRKFGDSLWRLSSASSIAESLMANTWQLLLTSWAEFGDGRDLRGHLPDQPSCTDVSIPTFTSINDSSSVKAKANLKRSFAETVACSKATDSSKFKAMKCVAQPSTYHKMREKLGKEELAFHPQYLKLQLNDHDFDVLEQRCLKARQGIVPITYSSADRAQIDAQSQLMESQCDVMDSIASLSRQNEVVQNASDMMDQTVGLNGDSSNRPESNILKADNAEEITGGQVHPIEYSSCLGQNTLVEPTAVKDGQKMELAAAEGAEERSRDDSSSSQECCVLQATLCDDDDMTGQVMEAPKLMTRDESSIFAEVVHHIHRARSTLQIYHQDIGQQPIQQNTDTIHTRDKLLSLWYESSKLTTLLYELSEEMK